MDLAPSPNDLSYQCDWGFGFNLNPKLKGTVGYLLFWSGCGGLNLSRDIEVFNPYSGQGQTVVSGKVVTCVGVIESLKYTGGTGDPIYVTAYVSKGTAADVRAKLSRPLTDLKVKVAWYIISYDEEKKAWYEAAFVRQNAKAEAVVDTAKGVVQMFIGNDGKPIGNGLDVRVYRLDFQIVPADGKTSILEFATGPSTRLVREWKSKNAA